jgi:signal transduction histidine kinase
MDAHLLTAKVTGISLLCDMRGTVLQLLCDEIGLADKFQIGQRLISAFDLASMEKASNFLAELKLRGVTLDWALSLMIANRPQLLHFSGGVNGETLFILGTKTPRTSDDFFEEFMKINNEQANKLRGAIKAQVQTNRRSTDNRDNQVYEELMQVNNELANTQRELAKKNFQLNQQRKQLERLNQELSSTIAELHHTQDELTQSEKMASLGRLVSGFAHELNTPIGIAVGSASALQEQAHKVKWLLEQEEVNVDDLVSSVNSIDEGFKLTLSNLERAGNLINSFKRTAIDQTMSEANFFNVSEVIQDTLNTLKNQFKKTAINLHVSCPKDLTVVSFAGALEQILTNLLINSLIHGFDEGRNPGDIHIQMELQGERLQLCYTDNGRGIAAEHLEKIFEPFFTTHRSHGGTGLGAYICYNLVTVQLKGSIHCDSTLGNGVTFRISYPVAHHLSV